MSDDWPMTPPPPAAGRDTGLALAKAALAAIPGFGGVAAELLGAAVGPAIERRFELWCAELAAMLNALAAKVDDLNGRLADNEVFVTTFITATQAAVRDGRDEKVEALRNAVGNAVLPDAPADFLQATYLRIIDELSPIHLRMLKVLQDPPRWFEEHTDLERPEIGMMGSRYTVLDAALPDLADHRDLMTLVATELSDRNLTQATSLATMMSQDGPWQPLTTDLGNGLLGFISTPAPLRD